MKSKKSATSAFTGKAKENVDNQLKEIWKMLEKLEEKHSSYQQELVSITRQKEIDQNLAEIWKVINTTATDKEQLSTKLQESAAQAEAKAGAAAAKVDKMETKLAEANKVIGILQRAQEPSKIERLGANL